MNVLIIGSGGRENALAWKVAQSPLISEIFVAPGNPGCASVATNIDVQPMDFEGIKEFILEHEIEILIVGPEEPLIRGLVDYLRADRRLTGLAIIGPGRVGAQLEGSKDFAKAFMQRHNIPTAKYRSFNEESIEEAFKFMETLKPPYVLKADGPAAGKGVLIIEDIEEAKQALKGMFDGAFGDSGKTVVIEEFLKGIECSVFVLTDGTNYKILPEAKDYKRIGEGDQGLNTGGMGAVSPVPFADEEFMEKVEEQIIKPTVKGLEQEDIDYQGFIFFGLINVEGQPMVIEYNCRMGDPETEVVLLRIKSDLVELLLATANQQLDIAKIEIDERAATTVVMVSGGYPQGYEKGKRIELPEVFKEGVVFHSGTAVSNQELVTSGGRVLAVSAYGKNMEDALKNSYEQVGKISFDKAYYRRDIGFDLK